jgi:DNA-binding NtrC family response regulator
MSTPESAQGDALVVARGSPAARRDEGAGHGDPLAPLVARLERILSRVASDPEESLPQVLDATIDALGARFAVFLKKESRRPRLLVGRWEGASHIGRPDRLLDTVHIEEILRSGSPRWVLAPNGADDATAGEPPGGDALRAGFRVPLAHRTEGAVVLGWQRGAIASRPATDPGRLAPYFALALTLDATREENSRLRREVLAAREAWTPEASVFAPPAVVRMIVEAAPDGAPCTESPAHLRALHPEIIGESSAVRAILLSVTTAARCDIPVLIEGESGTGKEIIARAIHASSRRAGKPFVCENCGAVPETLVESEFFGHEAGAFTGATFSKPGLFERADGGTVFLDEIGEMDLALQRRLLRVLQEKEVRKVGGIEAVPVDFRVISATNRVVEHLVASSRFREDLYYRLNVMTISVPSLRERTSDIPILLRHFNHVLRGQTGKGLLEFTDRALAALYAYPWPGNVRELRNEVLRLAATDLREVDVGALSPRILRGPKRTEALEHAPQRRLAQIEREIVGAAILEAIRQARGNRAEAARRLGVTRASLYRRLVRYGLLPALRLEDDGRRRSG